MDRERGRIFICEGNYHRKLSGTYDYLYVWGQTYIIHFTNGLECTLYTHEIKSPQIHIISNPLSKQKIFH